nr:hypothetical protein [Tanacetum cinerariifolium]
MVISKSSVRSDLHFNVGDGITCLSNDEIFKNLALMGYERVSTKRLSFPINGIPPVVKGEGSGQLSEPQPPFTTAPPEQVLAAVGDEVVYTGEGERVVRAATIAASLEAEQESDTLTRFETTSKQSHDLPLLEVNTSGSREDSMEHLDDLMDFVPPTPYDSSLPGGHTRGSDEGQKIGKEAKGKNSKDEALQDWYLQEKKENDVNAVEPVSTAGDAVNTTNVILVVSVGNKMHKAFLLLEESS